MSHNYSIRVIAGLIILGVLVTGGLIHSQAEGPISARKYQDPNVKDEKCDKVNGKAVKTPCVTKVGSHIYVAQGYALANVVAIEGTDGVIIVDTTESLESARKIYKAFREHFRKPIRAIIYTHNHADHIMGTQAFIEKQKDDTTPIQVWAHSTFNDELDRTLTVTNQIHYVRSMRQFGALLSAEDQGGTAGIGPKLSIDTPGRWVPPTHFLTQGEKEIQISGVTLRLLHIPGETDDQIGVWLPAINGGVMICADIIYKAFPNLYAIRGTVHRSALKWIRSIDYMINLNPEHLIPLHTSPISGKEKIHEILYIYRDAIQFVHDQTVRYMNKGKTPDEIVELVRLPDHLQKHSYLEETYGSVAWGVRAIFNGYMGWFDGNPVTLNPLSSGAKAVKLIEMMGGETTLLNTAEKSIRTEPQWALELVEYVQQARLYSGQYKEYRADEIKVEALKSLASKTNNANAKHYYLTCARELTSEIKMEGGKGAKAMVSGGWLTAEQQLRVLAGRLMPEAVVDVEQFALFHFSDTNKCLSLHIRNGIAQVRGENCSDDLRPDLKITTTTEIWRDIVTEERSANGAYWSGDLILDGGITTALSFFGYFDTEK